ncbi:MAG TPA: methylmalonyl-CoA epimerase [Candidatus Limnocylindrales bacterium]|nr:methylmalonyl-CoA epimerase [Candidatus Limnocylindrales bacterium]
MLSRIDHVGIAVRDLDAAVRLYRDRLGLTVSHRERLPLEGIEIAMMPIGDSHIELLAPLDGRSRLHKFLEDRGEAMHHLAYTTDDVGGALTRAEAAGAELIDRAPRPGAKGTQVAFIHPRGVCGVLTEFVKAG